MKEKTIYKSIAGKQEILAIYDKLTSMLNIKYQEKTIETNFGKTHILTMGQKLAPPLLFFHGGNSVTPHELLSFQELANHFQIFAVDTIGHPGKSAESRLKSGSFQYGEWAAQTIEAIGLKKTAAMGISYGAGILLNLAAVAPEKINKAVFLVPSGFVRGSICKMITKLALPMIRYRKKPTPKNLIKALSPLEPNLSPKTLELIGSVFKNLKIEAGMPRIISKKELQSFTAPSLVISGGEDILFPGEKVQERAKHIFSGELETLLIKDCFHLGIMQKETASTITKRIVSFLKGH